MARLTEDWLTSYIHYTKHSEVPVRMRFWSGVSAIAGALRRKVWIDQIEFKWYPNFYIVFVAPPGIVSKSTTAGKAYDLLRQVPGITFGANIITWEALVQDFAAAAEEFQYQGEYLTMSPISLISSEFGNLIDPRNTQMIDLFVDLWDGREGNMVKKTKSAGCDTVVNPWINLIACTTPSWIANHFPKYMVGGGFTSRTVFVYAEEKDLLLAYPGRDRDRDSHKSLKHSLVHDLEHISTKLVGEFTLTDEAYDWGTTWYEKHWTKDCKQFDGSVYGGYVARKQAHLHKTAMILSVSERDDLVITEQHLQVALTMLEDLEPDMHKVFSSIGKSEVAVNIDQLLTLIKQRGTIPYAEAYQKVFAYFPSARAFEDCVIGLTRSKQVTIKQVNGSTYLAPGPLMP